MLELLVVIIILFTFLPFVVLGLNQGAFHRGNRRKYSPKHMEKLENSPLKGKRVIFLGGAVTYGSTSNGISFVEFLEKRDGILTVKEAVTGTTMVDGKNSYITRMKTISPKIAADAFVCQLPVRDASKQLPLGEISKSRNMQDFDTTTITGAMEYIIAYAKATWNCPVIFYTSPHFVSKDYDIMVNRLLELEKKWDISVIDCWNDNEMQLLTREEQRLYMADAIHPTMAGYGRWWMPKFERDLIECLNL